MEQSREYPLANQARCKQIKFFGNNGHIPNEEQWLALEDILTTIEDAADGHLKDGKTYLSSIDCGIGKTTSLIFMIREILASESHADVSIMVCLNTCNQIRDFAKEINIDVKDIGIYTSDAELNALGNPEHTQARCLVTTQQMLDSRCGNDLVINHSEFLYKGNLRQVRVWDEALQIGDAISISSKMLYGAVAACVKVKKSLSDCIEGLITKLNTLEYGDLLHIPNFEKEFRITKQDLAPGLVNQSDEIKDAVLDLWSIQGKDAKVFKDSYSSTVINYALRIPKDLFPLLVLDAGARVAGTYALREETHSDIVRLRKATKSYKNLTVYGYDIASGKSRIKNREDIAKVITKVIHNDPQHDNLILQHKGADYLSRVDKHLDPHVRNIGDLFVCEWGSHRATNEFAHCDRTFQTSALIFKDADITSKGHLWTDTDITDELSKEQFALMKSGEIKENMLQGPGRSKIRKCGPNGDCYPSELHLFAAKTTGVFKYIQEVFPGCTLKMVKTVKVAKVPPKVDKTLAYIKARIEHGVRSIKFTEISEAMRMRPDNFKRSVRDNELFQIELNKLGLLEINPENINARKTHFGYKSDIYFKAA